MLFGILFQVIQFIVLSTLGLYFLLDGVVISKNLYILIFGGIMLVGLNILSLFMIVINAKDNTPRTNKEFKY